MKELRGNKDQQAQAEVFGGPARPRLRYERPKEARELPEVTSRWKYCKPFPPSLPFLSTFIVHRVYIDPPCPEDLAVATLAVTLWTIFLLHVMNAERLSSSVLRQVQYQLRNSEEVKALVGEGVRYAENWWGEYRRGRSG